MMFEIDKNFLTLNFEGFFHLVGCIFKNFEPQRLEMCCGRTKLKFIEKSRSATDNRFRCVALEPNELLTASVARYNEKIMNPVKREMSLSFSGFLLALFVFLNPFFLSNIGEGAIEGATNLVEYFEGHVITASHLGDCV